MSSRFRKLLERLNHATTARGSKAELSKWLGVPPSRVSEWLKGKKEPGAETTLRLLEWVTAKEEKQESPASVEAPAEPVTKTKESKHENQRPGRKRS
jgi:hypothetical protein